MLKFITDLFGSKKPKAKTPYKVEAPKLVDTAPKTTPAPKAKKPAVKKATTRKPKTPKAPK